MSKEYIQGFYKPIHPEKYIGNLNQIVFRSSYELKAFKWCDLTENIISWGSEEINIKYYDYLTNKIRRYYPDLILMVKESEETTRKYIVEIKPHKQTIKPKSSKRKKQETYLTECLTYEKNQMKWNAAKNFCEENGFIFKIITEKDLQIK